MSTDSRATDRAPLRWLHVAFLTFALAAGCMFVYKLFAFMKTIKKDELAGFAFDPIVIYGFVAMGFLCLLLWAYLSGQFRDVERPKFDMLERWAAQEAADARAERAAEDGAARTSKEDRHG